MNVIFFLFTIPLVPSFSVLFFTFFFIFLASLQRTQMFNFKLFGYIQGKKRSIKDWGKAGRQDKDMTKQRETRRGKRDEGI